MGLKNDFRVLLKNKMVHLIFFKYSHRRKSLNISLDFYEWIILANKRILKIKFKKSQITVCKF